MGFVARADPCYKITVRNFSTYGVGKKNFLFFSKQLQIIIELSTLLNRLLLNRLR